MTGQPKHSAAAAVDVAAAAAAVKAALRCYCDQLIREQRLKTSASADSAETRSEAVDHFVNTLMARSSFDKKETKGFRTFELSSKKVLHFVKKLIMQE